MKILIHPAIDAATLATFRAASDALEFVNAKSREDAAVEIADADGMYGHLDAELLAKASRLKWVQTPMAGLERYMFPDLIAHNLTLTNMRGVYSDHIADHVMGYVLTFARGLHVYQRRQLERTWKTGYPVIHLADCMMGIMGFGGIGRALAARAAAHEMRVVATDISPRDKPDHVAELWGSDRMNDLLEQSDFVVSAVPHTPDTTALIGAAQLRRMKPSAYLINISRGVVVDLSALTDALQQGVIAGAGLDVFETEPLPPDHPLWGMENVLITPHTAGAAPHTSERRVAVVTENLRRFASGEPLLNVVDKRNWC
ncbi:MAG: D-2-hydroxyacid dehydrogenase [Candidatus Poribacteria bacterium]|nr:D-2-hydroxyacid dehydrogenase [Candidatus Poribacteria bacterium]